MMHAGGCVWKIRLEGFAHHSAGYLLANLTATVTPSLRNVTSDAASLQDLK